MRRTSWLTKSGAGIKMAFNCASKMRLDAVFLKKELSMSATPQIVPITDLRKSHPDVLALLPDGPVFLAQRSRPAAVLLSIKQWERLNEQIEDMAALIDYLEVKVNLAEGKTQIEETTLDTLKAELDVVSASV